MTAQRQEILAKLRAHFRAGPEPTMADLARAAGISVRTLYRSVGSHDEVLGELDLQGSPSARARILERAAEMVGGGGLELLSMDDLADASAVSRANLYRLFPGKSALFRELVMTYSPWEAVATVIQANAETPPDQVIRDVAHALAGAVAGRVGLLLGIITQLRSGAADSVEGARRGLDGFRVLVEYLSEQMAAGRLRRMDPVLASQFLAAPIVIRELMLPLSQQAGRDLPEDEAIDEIAKAWLRALAPETIQSEHFGLIL